MASKKSSKSAIYYAQRLLEDGYIQGQLLGAGSALRSAYGRASKEPARAAEDKKLYGNLRQAATSIQKALVALRRPEPEPEPKHRLRTVVTATAVVGGSVLVISQRRSKSAPATTNQGNTEAFDSDTASGRVPEPGAAIGPSSG